MTVIPFNGTYQTLAVFDIASVMVWLAVEPIFTLPKFTLAGENRKFEFETGAVTFTETGAETLAECVLSPE